MEEGDIVTTNLDFIRDIERIQRIREFEVHRVFARFDGGVFVSLSSDISDLSILFYNFQDVR